MLNEDKFQYVQMRDKKIEDTREDSPLVGIIAL